MRTGTERLAARARGWTRSAAVVLLAGLAASGGCAGKRDGEVQAGPGTARTEPAPAADTTRAGGSSGQWQAPSRVAQSQLRERAIRLLVEASNGMRPEVRANAAEALSLVPSRLSPHIERLLDDANLGVRAVAAMSAGKARLANATTDLERLLRDPDPRVEASAIFALTKLGTRVDQSPLARMLTSTAPGTRSYAVFVLGELGNPSAVPMLREVARDPLKLASPAEVRLLRLQVAEALTKLGDDGAVHEIRAALYPSRPEELEATALACQMLGELKDRGSTDQLVYLTAYRDEGGNLMPAEVRLAAALALGNMGLREGGFIADEFRSSDQAALRAQAAHVYGRTNRPEVLSALEEMLEDPEALVRVAAAASIVRLTGGGRGS